MAGQSKANQRQSTRHKSSYKAYRDRGMREVNKARDLMRHIRSQPNDGQAKRALSSLDKHSVDAAKKRYEKASNS